MRSRLAWVLAIVVLATTAVVASAARIEVGSPAPVPSGSGFRGSDGAGTVSFGITLGRVRAKDGGSLTQIYDLHFANRCFASGSTVPVPIVIRMHAFQFNGRRFHASGSFDAKLTMVTGTLRVDAGGCDSGTLNFTASLPARH